MKKLLCVLLCLCFLASFAQASPQPTDVIEFAAGAMQATIDKANEEGITLFLFWDISMLDPHDIRKVAVMTASDEQVALLDSLADGSNTAMAVLSYPINRQFDNDYANAAVALALKGENAGFATDGNVLIWAVYDFHILLCLVRADGSWESVLMMSDMNVLKEFSEKYVKERVSMIGFPGSVEVEMLTVGGTQTIPEELIGTWQGIGTPKNGGTSIDLTITIEADGSGEYTFAQGKYVESYPFTVSHEDSTFAVDIPATSQLGKVAGTYALENDLLKLDITTTFPNGSTYSYTAECSKQGE